MQFYGTGRLSTAQNVAYTATAGTIANGVGPQSYKVRVVVTTAAFITIGDSPTATTSDTYMQADSPEYFTITPGQKVSAIRSSASGTLYVTEIT